VGPPTIGAACETAHSCSAWQPDSPDTLIVGSDIGPPELSIAMALSARTLLTTSTDPFDHQSPGFAPSPATFPCSNPTTEEISGMAADPYVAGLEQQRVPLLPRTDLGTFWLAIALDGGLDLLWGIDGVKT